MNPFLFMESLKLMCIQSQRHQLRLWSNHQACTETPSLNISFLNGASVPLHMGDAEPLLKTEQYICYMNEDIMKMLKHYRNTASSEAGNGQHTSTGSPTCGQ